MSLTVWFWLYVGLVFVINGLWDRHDERKPAVILETFEPVRHSQFLTDEARERLSKRIEELAAEVATTTREEDPQ